MIYVMTFEPQRMCNFLQHCEIIQAQSSGYKIDALKNLSKFTTRYLCQTLLKDLQVLDCNIIKRRTWHRCFLVTFRNFDG